MTDFASKYGFALAPDSDSDEGDNALVLLSKNKNQDKKPKENTTAASAPEQLNKEKNSQPTPSKVAGKMNTLLEGLLSESDSDSDTDQILAKFRAAKEKKQNASAIEAEKRVNLPEEDTKEPTEKIEEESTASPVEANKNQRNGDEIKSETAPELNEEKLEEREETADVNLDTQ